MIYGNSSGSNGASATAGVQLKSTGTTFTQFSFNSAVLTPGTRVDYVAADLELVVRGIDNGIYHNRFDGLNWVGFSEVQPGARTSSRPALAASANGTLDLVVRGIDNGIYHNHFSNSAWGGFSGLAGATIDAPALVSHGLVLDLVVRGGDNVVYHSRFNVIWSAFAGLGGQTPNAPALIKTDDTDLQVDLLVRGTDNGVYHNHFSGSWSGFVRLNGVTPSTPGLARGERPGTLATVVRGFDNGIYLSRFDGELWSPFSAVGGSMLSDPALVSP